MKLASAPDTYDRTDQDRMRAELERVLTTAEQQSPTSYVSGDRGDANVTLVAGDLEVQRFATALTANRTVTLSATGAGSKFRIVRTGLGAFTLDVGGLKTIPAGTAAFVDVAHDGTNWRLTAYGVL
jgi:hypothetical protein